MNGSVFRGSIVRFKFPNPLTTQAPAFVADFELAEAASPEAFLAILCDEQNNAIFGSGGTVTLANLGAGDIPGVTVSGAAGGYLVVSITSAYLEAQTVKTGTFVLSILQGDASAAPVTSPPQYVAMTVLPYADPLLLFQVFDPGTSAMRQHSGSATGTVVQYQLVYDVDGQPAATYASITGLGPIRYGAI